MRRESLRRPAPVRVPPRLPDLRLGKLGRSFEPALGRMALVTGLVAHAVAPLSVHGYAVNNAVGVDRLDCCFPLNGRSAIVGGLWIASDFIAFALVVSVWPVAVF